MGVCNQVEHTPLMSRRLFENSDTNHVRINIRSMDAAWPESFEDEFDGGPSAAPYFKTRRAWLHFSHFLEEKSLLPLHKQTNRAIHPYPFRPIHFHFCPL
jgi:hypothetical protein